MHFHFSSASTLALATAATLTLPFGANAADFVYRNGQKVATSLELPVGANNLIVHEGVAEQAGVHNLTGVTSGFTKSGAGQLIVSGESLINWPVTIQAGMLKVTGKIDASILVVSGALLTEGSVQDVDVSANGTLINNGSARNVTSLGSIISNGGLTRLTINGGSAILNQSGGAYNTTINGGQLANNGNIYNLNVATGAGFVNNQAGSVKSFSNSGISSNDGSMYNVIQNEGSFANGADGNIHGLTQAGGVTTNDGTINYTSIQSGTLTNNASGKFVFASVSNGALINGGKIENANVEALGNLTNNSGGVIDTLTNAGSVANAGTVANGGQIGTVTQTAGSITNNGIILGESAINGGTLTNNRSLGTVTIADGANFVNNQTGVSRALVNSGTTSNDGSINTVEQKAGALVNQAKGTISGLTQLNGTTTNNGTVERAIVEAGIFANNAGSTVGDVNIKGGELQNSGVTTSLILGENSAFANNANGFAGTVTSSGTVSNGGLIGELSVLKGTFNNSARIRGATNIGADGIFSSTGWIGGTLTNLGQSNLAGVIDGGISNASNAGVNLTGDLTGKGIIANNGTINSTGQRNVTGFDTLNNTGVMNIADDLSISGNVVSSGTIRLNGNNSGGDSLTVGGTLEMNSTSVTTLDIMSDGTHDTVSAAGDVTLGGQLYVTASGDNYSLKRRFSAFTSTAGEVVGNFADVVISGATNLFVTVEAATNGSAITVRNRDVLNEQLNGLGMGNEGQILTSLDYTGTKGAELFDTLSGLNAADAPGLMSQITGAATSAMVGVGSSAAQGFGNLMQKVATASGLRRSNNGVLAYEKARKAEESKFAPVLGQGQEQGQEQGEGQEQGAVGFWARGFGETGSNTAGGNDTLGGLGAGIEVALSENLTIGASAGYSMSRFAQGNTVEGKTNSFHGGGYVALGATAPEATGFGLTASGSLSKHDTNASRRIKIGTLNTVANRSYGGTTMAGEVMVRNGFTIGDTVPLTIAPIAGLKFSTDNDDSYTETGAGSLNLNVSGAKRRSLAGVVGLQLASRIETENMVFTPHISAAYQHEFLETSSITTRTLAGSTTPFTVYQGGGSRSSIALEAGLGLRFAGGVKVDVSGYGVISANENRYGATATIKAGF